MLMNNQLRLGSVASLVLGFAALLNGCDSVGESGAACSSGAECPAGETCNAGSCAPLGAVTAGTTGNVVGGSANAGGAGNGAAAGVAGTPPGGAPSSAGAGGIPAQAGAGTTGGASGNASGGGAVGGNGGTSGGSAGNGGAGGSVVVEPPVTVGMCKDDFLPPANNGSVTRYDFSQGTSLPACAYVITHKGAGRDGDWDTVEGISTGDGGYFGAMNTEDFAQGATCGACVEASYSGRKVVLTIVDECPKSTNPVCNKGHIDLSRKAIRQLEPNGSLENLKGVSWKYVKCPANGNVKARLHPNQNPDWQPVVIENGLYPLKSVTLNGAAATRTGNNSGGNAWIASGKKAPYTVHAVDVNNNAIRFEYAGGSNLTDTGLQFMCQ